MDKDTQKTNPVQLKPVATTKQVNEAGKAPEAVKAQEAPEPTKATEPVEAEAEAKAQKLKDFNQKLQKLIDTGSGLPRITAVRLKEYAERMDPSKLTEEKDISNSQVSMYQAISSAVESEQDFDECYGLIVEFFKIHHEGCCAMRYHSRGDSFVALGADERRTLFAHYNLLEALAGVKDKKHLVKVVDIPRTINESVFSDEGKNRLIHYYSS